jgi:peroxiredoxin Q/BCP
MAKKAKKKAPVKKKTAKKTLKKATKKATKKAPAKKKKATKKVPIKTVAKSTAKKKSAPKKNAATKAKPKKSTGKAKAKTAAKAKPAKAPAKKTTAKKSKTKTSAKAAKPVSGLVVGDTAPNFTMDTDTHGQISLTDYKGKSNVLLYFYPKDDTPGCTVQACTFQKSEHAYSDANVTVIGVSPDTIASHQKFRSKYSLGFTLASDPDHSVCEAYGVWVLKNNYGKEYMGVQRATFLIDKEGKIAAIWPKVKVEGHDAEVQEMIANLG